jgi:hypothetical protein
MPKGQRPSFRVAATDNSGNDHTVGALWSTASKEVFRGYVDLESNGNKVTLKIFADRPKTKAHPARGEQPAA